MTKEEYHHAVATYDERRREALIAAIPRRVNPTGKLYKKLLKQTYEKTHKHLERD